MHRQYGDPTSVQAHEFAVGDLIGGRFTSGSAIGEIVTSEPLPNRRWRLNWRVFDTGEMEHWEGPSSARDTRRKLTGVIIEEEPY